MNGRGPKHILSISTAAAGWRVLRLIPNTPINPDDYSDEELVEERPVAVFALVDDGKGVNVIPMVADDWPSYLYFADTDDDLGIAGPGETLDVWMGHIRAHLREIFTRSRDPEPEPEMTPEERRDRRYSSAFGVMAYLWALHYRASQWPELVSEKQAIVSADVDALGWENVIAREHEMDEPRYEGNAVESCAAMLTLNHGPYPYESDYEFAETIVGEFLVWLKAGRPDDEAT